MTESNRVTSYPSVFRERLERQLKNAPETAQVFLAHEMRVCDAALAMLEVMPNHEDFSGWVRNHGWPLPEALADMKLGRGQLALATSLVHWWFVNKRNIVHEHALMAEAVGCLVAGCHVENTL